MTKYDTLHRACVKCQSISTPYAACTCEPKSLGNTDVSGARKNVSDLVIFGEGDEWKLLSKASSKKEGWMKSTKAMAIPGVGCLVQVTTQQGNQIAEAVTFVPGVRIVNGVRGIGYGRTLVGLDS